MELNNINKRKRAYKKKKQWSPDEEALLITLWGDHIEEFRGCRRNSHIYEEIVCAMASSGFIFTSEEIRIKIHNLTNKYRDEKRKVRPSGGSPSSWVFYEKINLILGAFRSNSIELIMDESIAETQQTISNSVDDLEVENFIIEALDPFIESEFLLDSSTQESVEATTENETNASFDTPLQKKRKKNNFQNEVLNKIQESSDAIKKELEKLGETDQKMLKLQEEMVQIEKERNEILKLLLNK